MNKIKRPPGALESIGTCISFCDGWNAMSEGQGEVVDDSQAFGLDNEVSVLLTEVGNTGQGGCL